MTKHISNNLRIKRKYLLWLKDAKGLSEASIDKAAAAISIYEQFLDKKDFRAFHTERARAFKRFLTSRRNERNGANLSQSSINGILRELKSFYFWLADQAGYKSKITYSDAAYLTPDRKSETARRGSLWKPHPSTVQVRYLLQSMPMGTVIERRDRALVAFLFLTASRESAAISLKIGHVDLVNACVQFDGRTVNTKFGKTFVTAFYPVGEPAERIVRDWIHELKNDYLFSSSDPLFPKTEVGIGKTRKFQAIGITRKHWSGPSSAARIFKEAFVNAGLPPFSPHRIRNTIAELAKDHCRTPEDYTAWSQNMGHDDPLTTIHSYGSVSTGRQVELFHKYRERGPLDNEE